MSADHFYHIFDSTGHHVGDVPWQDDDDGGLPGWFFDGEFVSLEVKVADDTVEWIPACGPAPCWEARYSSFSGPSDMFAAWDSWARLTY